VTLILTYVGHPGILQVTDRLVSRSIGGRPEIYDASSNKNVIFAAKNGIATIAYTGLSFLDQGVHTDRWIAETLLGRRLTKDPKEAPPMMTGGGSRTGWPDIGQAVDRLQHGLARAMANVRPPEWRRHPPTLVVAGWIYYARRRKVPRPFACEIHHIPGLGYTRRWIDRHIYRSCVVGQCPSNYLPKGEFQRFASTSGSKAPLEAARDLIDQIRAVSRLHPSSVGPDCMCISLDPPRKKQVVHVRYEPLAPERGTFERRRGKVDLPIAYTPWLVTQGWVFAPRIMGGAGTGVHQLGWLEVHMEGPKAPVTERPRGIVHIEKSQQRRSSPQ
jgi:hypothetical protein